RGTPGKAPTTGREQRAGTRCEGAEHEARRELHPPTVAIVQAPELGGPGGVPERRLPRGCAEGPQTALRLRIHVAEEPGEDRRRDRALGDQREAVTHQPPPHEQQELEELAGEGEARMALV